MEWIRGEKVGRGSFGTVDLAIPKSRSQNSPLMVVKSSDFGVSDSLRNEREVLLQFGGECDEVVRCMGDERSVENGRDLYNLFFEYAAGGSLADRLRASPGNRFSEIESRQHANSILKGLVFIHGRGFVHCDIKLQNVLLFADGKAKISDFGLAKEKKSEIKRDRFELRGTPLYMSPEVVAGAGGDSPADIWALGCAVVEMVTGKPAWRCNPGSGVGDLLCRIAAGKESPEIPECISEDGKDFLSKCFMKDPSQRWTARMLLEHPFVSGVGEDAFKPSETMSSPRGPFDFPQMTPTTANDVSEAYNSARCSAFCLDSILKRVHSLAVNPVSLPDWSDFDGWVAIR